MNSALSFVQVVLLLGYAWVPRIASVSEAVMAEAAAHLAEGRKINCIKVLHTSLRTDFPYLEDHLVCTHRFVSGVCKERSFKKAAAALVSFHKKLVKLS